MFPKWRGHVPYEPRLRPALGVLVDDHPGLRRAIAEVPFAAFEAAHDDAPTVHCYRWIPDAARQVLAQVPERLRPAWLCALLIDRIAAFDAGFDRIGLPKEFRLHYTDAFHRILDQIERGTGFADIASDAFLKDLWLARGVMIPAYASILWPRSGLAREQIWHGGLRAVVKTLRRCGGRRPMIEGHVHDAMARAYWNEPGWRETMRLGAMALIAMPWLKGSFGIAWYYDPAVLAITPKLGFTHRMQLDHGAFRFRIGSSPATIDHALAANAARRNRYREGTYLPTDYAIVWPRRALIEAYGPDRRGRERDQ